MIGICFKRRPKNLKEKKRKKCDRNYIIRIHVAIHRIGDLCREKTGTYRKGYAEGSEGHKKMNTICVHMF